MSVKGKMIELSKQQWTFACAWVLPGCALLMVNKPCGKGRTTVSLVAYDDARPVRVGITKVRETWS
jgi:hypothetical protein